MINVNCFQNRMWLTPSVNQQPTPSRMVQFGGRSSLRFL